MKFAHYLFMRIEQKHTLGREEAIRRITVVVADLLHREPPGGVKVSEVTKSWTGDTMQFSFTAKKGFFGATISGTVQVADTLVTLEAALPGILTAFVPEEKISGDVQGQLAKVLAGKGSSF